LIIRKSSQFNKFKGYNPLVCSSYNVCLCVCEKRGKKIVRRGEKREEEEKRRRGEKRGEEKKKNFVRIYVCVTRRNEKKTSMITQSMIREKVIR
jgi:hypothetical protein